MKSGLFTSDKVKKGELNGRMSSPMNIPMLDLKSQWAPFKAELQAAFNRIFDAGSFILGEDVAQLERELERFLRVPHALGVSNGTDALSIALRAVGVGVGDHVLTSPFTFFATVSSICSLGAKPVFSDIEADTFNLDPVGAEKVLKKDPKIKAILPVHMFGQPANMLAFTELAKAYKKSLIEDAAQAIGATYNNIPVGSTSDFACFSFYPTKNLGALGDAGLVVSSKSELADKARDIRVHGMKKQYHHDTLGSNYRIDTLQAAFLRVFLPKVSEWSAARSAIAGQYDRLLSEIPGIQTPIRDPRASHVFHQYTIRVGSGKRDAMKAFLQANGIASNIYYPVPCHLQNAVRFLDHKSGDFPTSEKASAEVLSLPIYPGLTTEGVNYVADTIKRAIERRTD